jgi:hypothetical protein
LVSDKGERFVFNDVVANFAWEVINYAVGNI